MLARSGEIDLCPHSGETIDGEVGDEPEQDDDDAEV